MASYTPRVKEILRSQGCYFERPGRGDHEIWFSPITRRRRPTVHVLRSPPCSKRSPLVVFPGNGVEGAVRPRLRAMGNAHATSLALSQLRDRQRTTIADAMREFVVPIRFTLAGCSAFLIISPELVLPSRHIAESKSRALFFIKQELRSAKLMDPD